jgi:hypothetical protein
VLLKTTMAVVYVHQATVALCVRKIHALTPTVSTEESVLFRAPKATVTVLQGTLAPSVKHMSTPACRLCARTKDSVKSSIITPPVCANLGIPVKGVR